jgi:hypothetical protein
MNKPLTAVVLFVCLLLMPAQASAHDFIDDDSGQEAVVLHIDPDDDPIAGQPSTLFFDLQNVKPTAATLGITTEDGRRTKLSTHIAGPVVSTHYTFAEQGVYRLDLEVHSGAKTYGFHYTQRVAGGVAASQFDETEPLWADVLLYGGAAGILAVMLLAVRYSRDIMKNSQPRKRAGKAGK